MKGNQAAGKNLTASVLHSEHISVSIRQTCHTFPLVFYSHICHMHAATILTYQESLIMRLRRYGCSAKGMSLKLGRY